MTLGESEAVVMFLALFALYSPPSAVASYIPLVKPFDAKQRLRLAIRLFVNVAVIAVGSLWFGEPLLHILGLSTAALAATGGTALILASVPMMIGTRGARADCALEVGQDPHAWRSIVFMPITFPLTNGGATVGLLSCKTSRFSEPAEVPLARRGRISAGGGLRCEQDEHRKRRDLSSGLRNERRRHAAPAWRPGRGLAAR